MRPSINEKLYLVIPIYEGDTIIAYVHSAPISREVFEAHWLLISKTFTQIFSNGLGLVGGPRVASLVLRDIGRDMPDPGEALTLLNEIRRLTNVLTRTPNGWESIPFQDAVDQNALSEDDVSEVTNSLVFFTVNCAMQQKKILKDMMDTAAKMWGAQTSSLDLTGFSASLETSTGGGHITKHHTPASSVVF